MGNYTYLFPFEKIEPHSKILIYGAGTTGIEYLEQVLITNYCHVAGVVDKNASRLPRMVVPIYGIDEVSAIEFDYIVIALKNPIYNDKIIYDLKQIGVSEEKIVFVGGRKNVDSLYVDNGEIKEKNLAFNKKGISVAIEIASGIGDIIISKRFIMQLLSLSSNLKIDIYCSNNMAGAFYGDTDKINAIVTPQVATFHNVLDNYMIAISRRFYLTIYRFKYESVQKYDSAFAGKMQELYVAAQNFNDDCAVNERLRMFYERADYSNKSVFYYPNYFEDILQIKDNHVDIPLREQWKDEFTKLNFKRYITMNYGNGVGSSKISKQWPLSNFSTLVKKIKQYDNCIQIVQLGTAEAGKIANCDGYILGEDIELVKYILLNSLLHIDIEGGLVHVATHLGTKCVVLFGPTSMKAFGYPQNINIKAGDCHNCCGVESNIYQCARHLETPACMEAITVDMVYKDVVNYLDTIL
ncbi:hypothetical protein NZ47_11390 [Anaerovibrio lipolyticus]|uniref:ADP-heptose:LPS heptosyltransferase n=1 Tax=Anaerovibrio lipolyticus TaxID=82374 RepID=A0A0B2JSI9_9FIRM|nr:glycosyltransferase family 9 protein [Anaerovibrio lipolyticus]KHM51280.1 hypothetical protein NZ47_11390 [Anaerovibrio lipolyticus]